MRFGMSVNMDIPDAPRLAKKVIEGLKGHEVLLENEVAARLKRPGMSIDDMDVDMMITVGGDGTILRALHHNNAPIFGVNAGDLGFLTTVMEDELEEGLENIINGNYSLDRRSRLKTVLAGRRLKDAVNESVVHTAHIAKIRHFQVHVDGELAVNVRADGIIVATPTGSTCYAMSVGAPLLDPRVNALVIAPMAPFKFAARPVVVPSTSKITLRVVRPKECVVVIDGQEAEPMQGNETVEFTASETDARFVTFGKGFYTRTREKLMGSLC
ncbi:MAG: NAD(+)/NADH kinase [Methanomassiliicoccales archaeon]|nr:MAG: NAD(+)/NADH kinase [Methanomassiliicoccales archaeon]